MLLMKEKRVLVTASTQGIGLAIAKLALSEGANQVVINGRDEAKLKKAIWSLPEEQRDRASYVVGDLSQDGEAKKVVDKAVEITGGELDVVINSAGVSTRGNIETTTLEIWNEIFDLNVKAAFEVSSAAIAHFKKNGISGSITHNVSINAVCGERFLLPYSMSKGALQTMCHNLGHALAMERAEKVEQELRSGEIQFPAQSDEPWIRVNGILTGWVLTEGELGYKAKEDPSAPKKWYLNPPLGAVPSGMMTQPEEIASTFLMLASDFSRHINGQCQIAEQFCLAGSPPRNLS